MAAQTESPTIVLSDREHAAVLYHYPTSDFSREWFRLRVWAKTVCNDAVLKRIADVDHQYVLIHDTGKRRETSEYEVS